MAEGTGGAGGSGGGVGVVNQDRIDFFRARGLSPGTAKLYSWQLSRLEAFLQARGTELSSAGPEELTGYVDTLPRTHSLRTQLRSALRHFYEDLGRPNPPLWAVRPPRKPPMRCKALDPNDASRLAEAARARHDQRGLAVLVGLYGALRRAEIASLRWEDVDVDTFRVLGKGERTRFVPIHPVLAEALAEFRQPTGPLFPGARGRSHVNPATIWEWVRVVAAEIGLDGLKPHQLRHTALATANDATGDLRAVQELAGHSRPETTAGYTRVLRRRLTATVEAIDYGTDHSLPGEKRPAKAAPLAYRRVVSALAGSEQETELWCALAVLLQKRPGWRFEISAEYGPVMAWQYGADLSVFAMGLRDRPAWIMLSRQEGPGEWDFLCWDFESAEALAELLEAFETGEPLPAPPSWFPGQDDGGLRVVAG